MSSVTIISIIEKWTSIIIITQPYVDSQIKVHDMLHTPSVYVYYNSFGNLPNICWAAHDYGVNWWLETMLQAILVWFNSSLDHYGLCIESDTPACSNHVHLWKQATGHDHSYHM